MTHAKQGLQMMYLGCHNMFTKTKEKNLMLINYTARVWCLQIIKLYLHFYFTTLILEAGIMFKPHGFIF